MEVLKQIGSDMRIRENPIDGTYTARIFGHVRTFETLEQAVERCCMVRDRGGKV